MLPNKIKVAGIDYQIQQVEEIDDDPSMMGSCIYQKSIIKIKSGMSQDKKEQTLVHEMLHACFNEAGFDEQDEDMINRIGIVLYQVLKDNELSFGKTKTQGGYCMHEVVRLDRASGIWECASCKDSLMRESEIWKQAE